VKHISTAVWAPPSSLQWHEVALELPQCTQCTAQHQQQAQQCVQGTYCGGWRVAPLCVFRRENSGFGDLALASTTYNNLTADLLPTREVPCAWPAPALAGWCCYLGVLPLNAQCPCVPGLYPTPNTQQEKKQGRFPQMGVHAGALATRRPGGSVTLRSKTANPQ
jgi:hypothetical protein